jgi:hypothetical protein
MKLSTWWLPQTSGTHIRESRWFKLMYTLQGKTQSTRHKLSTLDPRRVPGHTSHVVHVDNLSPVHTSTKQAPTPRRNLGDQRQIDLAIVLGHLIPPSSWQPLSRGERFPPSSYTATLAYWPHIPACDQYVQCLLMGANPSVLNRHRQGLQSWRCRLFTYHSPTFPINDLHFPSKGLTQSQVIHPIITKRSRKGTNPKSREWELPLDFYHKLSSKHSVC